MLDLLLMQLMHVMLMHSAESLQSSVRLSLLPQVQLQLCSLCALTMCNQLS